MEHIISELLYPSNARHNHEDTLSINMDVDNSMPDAMNENPSALHASLNDNGQQQLQGASPHEVHRASLAFESNGKPFSCCFAFCKGSKQGDLLPSDVMNTIVQATLIHSTW
eukprot:scaffold222155_cov14-Tisochrysis_lutea.AAC.1